MRKHNSLKTIAVIPARLGSTRLPGKVLADIHGHPLIWHVWNRVKAARRIDQVFVATDAAEVQQVVEEFGCQVLMTSPECKSGTERIASALQHLQADLILNVQGDEPLTDAGMLDRLVDRWQETRCDLITPIFRISSLEELQNPNIVKVVRAADGRAIYFSRSPVPYMRDIPVKAWLENAPYWGHIGVYGYRRDVLARYAELPASLLEDMEKLEQLRFLEAGYTFQTVETTYRPVAVDVADDLERVRQLLKTTP